MVLVCMGRRERCTTDGVGESWLCGERGKKVCLHYVDSGFRVTLAANPVRKCSAAPAGWPLPLSLSDGGGVICLSGQSVSSRCIAGRSDWMTQQLSRRSRSRARVSSRQAGRFPEPLAAHRSGFRGQACNLPLCCTVYVTYRAYVTPPTLHPDPAEPCLLDL